MEYVTERESTKRAPMRPVEVNYINADIHGAYEKYTDADGNTEYVINDPNVFNEKTGFQFTFPSKWATYPSSNKLVGIRRLFYWACPVNLAFTIYTFSGEEEVIDTTNLVFDDDDGCYTYTKTEEEKEVKYYYEPTLKRTRTGSKSYNFSFTPNTSTYDAIGEISTAMNDAEQELDYDTQFKYDVDSLTLTMKTYKYDNDDNTYTTIPFKLIFRVQANEYAKNFLRLFNQSTSKAMVTTITEPIEESLTLTNVWDREFLFFHASFSDSTRQLIGYQADEWPDANVYYAANISSDDFIVRFTQDGVTKVLPRNGVLMIQLSLIYNYDHSFLM